MAKLTLAQVQKRIKAKTSIRWEAGETSVSHLALVAKPGMAFFGIGAQAEELAASGGDEIRMAAAIKLPAVPKSIDWRNMGAKNYLTSVKNQLDCGACVAFATCAALESRDAVKRKAPNPSLDLSEAHLFFCGCGACCGTGWQPASALAFAQSNGVGLETSFPYTPHNQPCQSGVHPHLTIASHSTVSTMRDRKRELSRGGPVIAAMKVFRDFPYYKGGIYTPVSNDLLGLHAVCIIGYNTPGKYWIIKNSWGPGWGSGGFGRIAFGTSCEIDKQFPFWVPAL